MARGWHPTWQDNNNGSGPNSGPPRRKRSFSGGYIFVLGLAVVVVLFMAAVGVIAAQTPSSRAAAPDNSPTPAESPVPVKVMVEPAQPAPNPEDTRAPSVTEGPAEEDVPEVQLSLVESEEEVASSVVQAPRTVASSWSAEPTPAAPAPAPAPAGEAVRLAAEAEEAYGVLIIVEGQNWGAVDEAQAINVQAVISAIDRLPDTIVSTVVAHGHGPLTFVSNDQGRTAGGWQPYGEFAIAYYTNSDQGPGGYHASNQVVLSVGAGTMSIGHEMLHAYQFRNVGPDEYALALLQPEMRSFMEATGWRQTSSDDDVRLAATAPWSALDSLYVYEGRPLSYVTSGGASTTISAANPIEAFAIAGSIYYTRPSWVPLPDWPEYWDWFSANVG